MGQNNRKIGTNYEKIAANYLETVGYEIIECNFRCSVGEIDIIAKENGYLVFCEVKYRRTANVGHPLEAVSLSKQKKISKCARYYIHKNCLYEMQCRFDVLGILGTEFQLVQNAFNLVE